MSAGDIRVAVYLAVLVMAALSLNWSGVPSEGDHASESSSGCSPAPGERNTGLVVMDSGETVVDLSTVQWPESFSSRQHVLFGMWYYRTIDGRLDTFVKSLRRTGCDAAVVLFMNSQFISNATTLRFAKRYGVSVVGFTPRKEIIHKKKFWVSSLRFVLADAFLQRYPFFKAAAICDLRDAAVQEDPFRYLVQDLSRKSPNLRIVAAAEVAVIGDVKKVDYGLNHKFVMDCFGKAAADGLNGSRALCSGTTLGLMPEIGVYFRKMTQLSLRNFECARLAQDQGVHNYLLRYDDAMKRVVHVEDPLSSGRILTMQGVDTVRFHPRTLKLLNADGKPFVITHQLPRCGRSVKHLLRLKIAEDDTAVVSHTPVFEVIPTVEKGDDGTDCDSANVPPYLR